MKNWSTKEKVVVAPSSHYGSMPAKKSSNDYEHGDIALGDVSPYQYSEIIVQPTYDELELKSNGTHYVDASFLKWKIIFVWSIVFVNERAKKK